MEVTSVFKKKKKMEVERLQVKTNREGRKGHISKKS